MHLLAISIKTRSVCLITSYVTKWHTCLPLSCSFPSSCERSSLRV